MQNNIKNDCEMNSRQNVIFYIPFPLDTSEIGHHIGCLQTTVLFTWDNISTRDLKKEKCEQIRGLFVVFKRLL